MPYLLNLLYLLAWLLMAPWLCWQAWFRNKPVRGLKAKWFGVVPAAAVGRGRPVAWFHGVSLGEIHLLRQLVGQFRQRFPGWHCVISTTTNTGYAEACKHFSDLPVIFFPFDFTWSVGAALDSVRPDLVVLAEGEIWPNFVRAAKRQGTRIAVINARMSPRSARHFARLRPWLAGIFADLDLIACQNEEYRRHYELLGAPCVVTTGNIKYDGVNTNRQNDRTLLMRSMFGLAADALVWVVGSSQDPEESLAIEIYRRARVEHPNLRLILVPRHPERFGAVEQLLQRSGLPFVKRSSMQEVPADAIILGDSMGELGAIWGLADVAFVGGSLDGKRGGQNMIEPSAYGSAVLFGPHTWNFKQTVADLLACQGAIQVQDADALETAVLKLCDDPARREQLGEAARKFVLSQQGATRRTLEELSKLMGMPHANTIAA
jgi:3-deoxy-D-manno-octulosonic-acid transferase